LPGFRLLPCLAQLILPLELRLFGRDGDHAPDSYDEFLFRSPVALWREPTAGRREAGSLPRR
jgi:hypothetical protein